MCNFAPAFFTNTSIGKCRVDGWGSLTAQSLANSESIVKDKATGRCPHGVSIRTLYVCFINMEGNYIHHGVGSACCSSNNRGNARRLEQRDE